MPAHHTALCDEVSYIHNKRQLNPRCHHIGGTCTLIRLQNFLPSSEAGKGVSNLLQIYLNLTKKKKKDTCNEVQESR